MLQHAATHCTTLHHAAPHCNTLQHTRKRGFEMFWKPVLKNLRPCGAGTLVLQHTAAHCNAPQHTATHCNTLQHTATNTHKRSQDVLKTLRASTDAMFRRAPTNQRTPHQNSLSSVGHDSFICVTWLIHMCDMTHSYVWHDSCVIQLMGSCSVPQCTWRSTYIKIYQNQLTSNNV